MACGIDIPLLSEDVIISVIRDITKVPFTANDLKTPTYEKLFPVYNGFVCSLLNVSTEQIMQVPLHVMETISLPELSIDEAVGKISFFKALEYIFSACGITDFGMNDLIAPTKKRTRKLLSAISNFAQFCSQREPVKNGILLKLDTMLKDREISTTKCDKLKEKIATLKAERLEKQRAVQEMNLSALKARQHEIAEMKDQKLSHDVSKRAEVEELQNVLTVARASKSIRQGKESIEEHLARGHDLDVKETLYNEFCETVPTALNLIKNIGQDMDNFLKFSNDSERINDQSVAKSIRYKSCISDSQNTKRLIQGKLDKQYRSLSKHAKRMELCHENEMELQRKEEEVSDKKQLLFATDMELNGSEESILSSKEEHRNTWNILNEKYNHMLKQFSNYNNTFTKNFRDIDSKLQDYKD